MITLRPYQEDCLNAFYNYFASGKTGNPVAALPCGCGKTVISAEFMRRAMMLWPSQRFIYLVHTQELVEQTYNKLLQIWRQAPAGVYCAGLGRKETTFPIICGTIGSVVKNSLAFGHRDIAILDECQMLSPNDSSMYQKYFADAKKINPRLKIVGLSATPFRIGQGMVTDDGLLTDVCYDITRFEEYNKLVRDKYLSHMIAKKTVTQLDVSSVGIQNGEFAQGQLEKAVDKEEITYNALREALVFGADRRSWLCFASGIDHAEHIAKMLRSFGVSAQAVHSKVSKDFRRNSIEAHKNNELKCLVGFKIFTVGYDNPQIDMIIDLQPTMSAGLHVQKYGRGGRPSPETFKENCLILDYAGNTARNGPINDPQIPKKKGKSTGEIPVKICEKDKLVKGEGCGCYNHISARVCEDCGCEFKIQVKITEKASTQEILRPDTTIPLREFFNVDHVTYRAHNKLGSKPCLRVEYLCGMRRFKEFVFIEGKAAAAFKARDWWRKRSNLEPPNTVEQALNAVSVLRKPRRIEVHLNTEYPTILQAEF